MLSCDIVPTLVFRISTAVIGSLKIKTRVMRKLSIPLDRARWILLGTLFGTVGTHSWTNIGCFYSNMVPGFYWKNEVFCNFFDHRLDCGLASHWGYFEKEENRGFLFPRKRGCWVAKEEKDCFPFVLTTDNNIFWKVKSYKIGSIFISAEVRMCS